MKSLKSYISESLITESIGRTDPEILKREYRQPQFPMNWKAPKGIKASIPPISTRTLIEIAHDVFGCRYGNIRECHSMPQYNMFNAMHVKQMVFKTSIEEAMEKYGIAVPVASYTADTDLGPQMIFYLTEAGENILHDAIMPKY